MPSDSRLQALQSRHSELEQRIMAELGRPRPDDATLRDLKRNKLQLKDQMERIKPRPN